MVIVTPTTAMAARTSFAPVRGVWGTEKKAELVFWFSTKKLRIKCIREYRTSATSVLGFRLRGEVSRWWKGRGKDAVTDS